MKYNSVEELPYMEGIKDSLQINSLAEVIPVEYVTQQSAIAASELQKSVEFATSQSTTRLSLDANTQRSILTPQMVAENIVDSLDMPITEAQAANLSTHIADAYVDAAECIAYIAISNITATLHLRRFWCKRCLLMAKYA